MSTTISNKINETGIVSIDLIDFAPEIKSISFDLVSLLYEGLIVKEKDFKSRLRDIDWNQYRNKPVAVNCSVDTIIPPWAYMLVSSHLKGIASRVEFTSAEELNVLLTKEKIKTSNFDHLENQKVVVLARPEIPPSLYISISQKLTPIVKTLLYGEVGLPKVIWKNK